MSFPAAILAAWIVLIVLSVGSRYAREEIATGVEPKGTTAFIFTCIGLGTIVFIGGHFLMNPFLYHLANILTGALIGLGTAHFVPRLAHSLRQGKDQSPE